MAQATTNEIRNTELDADVSRRTYEPPLIVDLGDAAELTQVGGVGGPDGPSYS